VQEIFERELNAIGRLNDGAMHGEGQLAEPETTASKN
jgi:hypothetical protein